MKLIDAPVKRHFLPGFKLKSGLLALLLSGFISCQTLFLANAQSPADFNIRPGSREEKILQNLNQRYTHFPVQTLYNVKARKMVGLERIFEFDNDPLEDRIPVILVPGRAEEFQPNSWWKKFNRLTDNDKAFQKDFKLYIYVYNSKLPLNVQASHFNRDMKEFYGQLPDAQKSILVTYSLGGLIAVEALRDKAVLDKVNTMLAIAVPFHGSPMFDPSWFSTYLRPPNHSPVRKFWDRAVYRAYLFDKTNLIEGLRWDNFDGSLPQFDAVHLNIHGDQVFVGPSPCIEDDLTLALKKKTILYTSYVENEYIETYHPPKKQAVTTRIIKGAIKLPMQIAGVLVPSHIFNVHAIFPYMSIQLANLPTFTPENPEGKNTHLYRYNDGVIPMSSLLWLPKSQTPYRGDFQSLVSAADVAKVRVFVNLDHTHIGDADGYQPSRVISQDVLHPDEGKRKPKEWLLKDILSLNTDAVSDESDNAPTVTDEKEEILE